MSTRPRLDAARVTRAAREIADADGIDAVTLARVAAAVGVRTPSLYHHVDGLDALRRAVALQGLVELGEAARDATVGRSGPEALRAMADAYRRYAAAAPGAYAAAQRIDLRDDEETRAAAERSIDVVLAVVRHWERDAQAVVHLARGIRSALHGFVSLEQGHGFGYPASTDESFAVLVGLLTAGLDAHAAARSPGD